MSAGLDRRAFLGRSLAVGGAAIAAQTLGQHAAWADSGRPADKGRGGSATVGYGELRRTRSKNTGEELLALPVGFTYTVFGLSQSLMSDGNRTPIAHDGMAAFAGPDGLVRLIRNHEVRTTPGSPVGRVEGPAQTRYDTLGVGGTTTLDYDTRKDALVRDFVSLNGTIVNCAGGKMLDDAGWITCEETTAGTKQGWQKKHGYCFIVPLMGPEPGQPATSVPIPAMGRFSHEAVAVDPATGFVYETEDNSGRPNGFFRYRPTNPSNLMAGGVLEMLKVKGTNKYDARKGQAMGTVLAVEWVRINDPDPDLENGATTVTNQGLAQGATIFNRLEGCWYGQGSIFFNSTSGGDAENGDVNSDGYREGFGQVWQYIAGVDGGQLVLLYESPGRKELDSPDNLLFTPRGGIILCEDDASSDGDTHPLAPGIEDVNRLIGLTLDGRPFEFAVNVTDDSEFAGACFSPDGKTLFVNTLGNTRSLTPPGRTYAISGPWARGPL